MEVQMTQAEDRDAELLAFKEQQTRVLAEFETKQRRELEAFEAGERQALEEFERREGKPFQIKIDRTDYEVRERLLTGAQLRQLPQSPIGEDRDLFEVVAGGTDRKIADDEEVRMRDGLRFFTAPSKINPGAR
jgi:multiubiquitin